MSIGCWKLIGCCICCWLTAGDSDPRSGKTGTLAASVLTVGTVLHCNDVDGMMGTPS
jgi:hypothetical protein